MALTLSRIDRRTKTYDLATVFPDLDGPFTAAEVALLPPRSGPTAATVWFSVPVASGVASVLLAGPDADSTGALVVPASADLWMRIADSPEVDAEKLERITVLGGGPALQMYATKQALIGLDVDGVPFYDPSGIGTPAAVALDSDGVLYFTP